MHTARFIEEIALPDAYNKLMFPFRKQHSNMKFVRFQDFKNMKFVIAICVFACVFWVAQDSTFMKKTNCMEGLS